MFDATAELLVRDKVAEAVLACLQQNACAAPHTPAVHRSSAGQVFKAATDISAAHMRPGRACKSCRMKAMHPLLSEDSKVPRICTCSSSIRNPLHTAESAAGEAFIRQFPTIPLSNATTTEELLLSNRTTAAWRAQKVAGQHPQFWAGHQVAPAGTSGNDPRGEGPDTVRPSPPAHLEEPASANSCLLDTIFKACWASKRLEQGSTMPSADSAEGLPVDGEMRAGRPQRSSRCMNAPPAPPRTSAEEAARPASSDARPSMHDSACSMSRTSAKQQDDSRRSSSADTVSPQDSLLTSLQASAKEDEILQPHLPEREPCAAKLHLPEWLISPYDLSFCTFADGKLCRLGSGTFGSVYRGTYKDRTVAIKVCKHKQVNKRAMDVFRKEVTILYNYRHPNIVSFIGACTWQGGKRTVILTSFMDKGDLYEALRRHPARYKWHARGRRIALEVAQGLQFLHSQNIVHFDLKSANILLDRHHCAQIADVGLSKTLTNYHDDRLATYMATTDWGTFAWSAPEVLLGQACDAQADIYSFGVVLWELATARAPSGRDLKPIMAPEEGCAGLAKIIARCLKHKPADRPSASELVGLLQALQ